MKYLKKFENHTQYENYINGGGVALPNVSLCEQENEVHYNPYVEPPFFCKLTLNDDSVVEIEGSGELAKSMVSPYRRTLVSAEIGELCTSIGFEAIGGCYKLTSIIIPDSVTNIDSGVFYDCTALTSVTIPNSVTSMGDRVFINCSSLTSITLGSGITSIGNSAFTQCYDLTSITSLATTAPTIESYTFADIGSNGTLTVPSGSTGYDVWMGTTGGYYLGYYNWTKVEQ